MIKFSYFTRVPFHIFIKCKLERYVILRKLQFFEIDKKIYHFFNSL